MSINSNWIWLKPGSYRKYNDIVIAKKDFDISGSVQAAVASVTADSYYRLFVNGKWICDGPARGWPEHYYYDQVDITRYLQQGTNEVKIIACYHGVGHFHGIPQQAGLLAQLDIEYANGNTKQIITDQSWQIAKANGWQSNTPKISCQMAPAEYYDAALGDSFDYSDAAVICKANGGPWKGLKPRDVAILSKIPVCFDAFFQANVLKKETSRIDFCLPWARILYPGLVQANRRLMPAFCLASILKLEKKAACEIQVEDYRDGNYDIFIDGFKKEKDKLNLDAGRHLIFISYGLSLNHATDITISVDADVQFELSNPYNKDYNNPWGLIDFDEYKYAGDDLAWTQHPQELQIAIDGYRQLIERLSCINEIEHFVSETSAKVKQLFMDEMFAKDNYLRFLRREVVSGADANANITDPEAILTNKNSTVDIRPCENGDIELVYDLGKQNVGYYSFEVDAQAGVEIDIYGIEYIDAKGRVQYTDDHRNGMTYVTKAGKSTFTSLKRRSGRYIFIRFNKQTKPIKLKSFNLIESTYPVEYKGSFECSDEKLNRIWDISAYTLKLCMEDTFTDCPLYEQTLWVGDARNESLLAFGVFGSTDIAKRCIILASQSLERFPMVGCQLPSSWYCILPAWSFMWGISVWDYYWYTKDVAFLAEMWPTVIKNLKGAESYINNDGLFSADFWNMFDWANIDQDHETVFHNSMFMVGAIDAAIDCGKALGTTSELDWLEKLRSSLKESINNFWQDNKKSYPDSIHENGTVSDSTSQHTSFLSLLYDIAKKEHTGVLLENIISPPESMAKVGSPFAILFMYEMLDKLGMPNVIIKSIYDNYVPMLDVGATTVWESFAGTRPISEGPTRSHCHAWSSAPVYFFNRIILGIRQTSPGCENFEISPHISDIDWAKGSFATPHGAITVSWQKDKDKLNIEVSAPDNIEIVFKENDTHLGLDVEFSENTFS